MRKRLSIIISVFLILFIAYGSAIAESVVYYADPTAADQGAAGTRTIKGLMTAIGSTKQATIVLAHTSSSTNTTYTVSTDLTLTSNITLKVDRGALVAPATGKTLTISGTLDAGDYQIFSGTGLVSGLGYAESIWFGTVGNGVANDRNAIQYALSSIVDGGKVYINRGTYSIVNAIGAGATLVDKRADAVANGTRYPLTFSANYATLEIAGDLVETTILEDLLLVTGHDTKVIGVGGSLSGNGEFLDTNSNDTTLQWEPKLIHFTGDNCEVYGLRVIDPPCKGISAMSVNNWKVHDNYIIGGVTAHGAGTRLFGIIVGSTVGDKSRRCEIYHNHILKSTGSGMVYSAVFAWGEYISIKDNIIEDALGHAFYCYGTYITVSGNISYGASMLAAHIQCFSDNLNITNNMMHGGVSGISVACGRNSLVADNKIYNITLFGITYGTYTGDTDDVNNLTITDNIVQFDTTSAYKQGGIEIATSYNMSNLIVANNTIVNSGMAAPYYHAAITVKTSSNSYSISNATISGNIMKDSDALGMFIVWAKDSKIINNQVINPNVLANANYAIGIKLREVVDSDIIGNTVKTDTIANVIYPIYMDTDCNRNVVKNNNLYPFKTAPIHITGTVYGETVNVTVGTIAKGASDEKPVLHATAGGSPHGLLIYSAEIVSAGAVTHHGTDYFTIKLLNRSTDGVGNYVGFTSGGTAAIALGDTITGATSSKTAYVDLVSVTSGSWAGGDAAGHLMLSSKSGTLQAENLNTPTQNDIATIAGDATTPMQIATFNTSATDLVAFVPQALTLSAVQLCKIVLNGQVVTFAKTEAGAGEIVDEMLVKVNYITF